MNEDLGATDPVNVPGIIAEEETTKGSKCTDEIGLPCDGSLDEVDVSGAVNAYVRHGLLLLSGKSLGVSHCVGRVEDEWRNRD